MGEEHATEHPWAVHPGFDHHARIGGPRAVDVPATEVSDDGR